VRLSYGVLGAALCLLLLVPLAVFFWTGSGMPAFVTSPPAIESSIDARLVFVEGTVQYREDGGVWQAAEANISLKEGASVRVDGAGRAAVLFEDGSIARLNADTWITFSVLDDDHMLITNEYGDLYTRVAKKEHRMFDVSADGNVYRALGTAYRTFNTKEKKGLVVYESAVEVLEDATDGSVAVEQGKAYYETNSSDSESVGEVLDITLAELQEDTFARWNAEEDKKLGVFEGALGVLEELVSEPNIEIDEEDKQEVSRDEDFEKKDASVSPPSPEIKEPAEKSEDPEPEQEADRVRSISLWSGSDSSIKWFSDTAPPRGFQVVWSKNQSPTYPPRARDRAIYKSDPNAQSTSLNSFDGPGIYYVRVCEYLGRSCGTYSPQIQIKLLKSE
jgi:hypothetical protein